MPLVSIPAEKAVATRKKNPDTYWGSRSSGNRVEPVARPEFYPSFTLEPGEKIFTIGSCFARHVEDELLKRGLNIPVRELMQDPLFADLGTGVLNNYGTPSIYNELSWALEPSRPFVPADHIIEVKPGKFVDLHLPPDLHPVEWDVVLARRMAIQQLVRLSVECRVVIITLGLAEVWYDTKTGYYLNDTVRPSVLRLHPGRFELHVLSFEEAFSFLEKSLLLMRDTNHNELRVVLSVSPVPMAATHRPMDVIVANSYSKSLLRTVAENICTKYDWVDYYPSYESVMLSDRKLAWEADLIHVTSDIVSLNVGRMVDRYLPASTGFDELAARISAGGTLVAEQYADQALEKGAAYAEAFFAEFGAWSERSPSFAIKHARFLEEHEDDEEVIRVMSHAPAGSEPLAAGLLVANAQLRLGRAADAIDTLTPLIHDSLRSQDTWELLVQSYVKAGDSISAIAITQRYLSAMPYRQPWAFLNLARSFRQADLPRAVKYYELVVDEFLDSDQWIQYEIADFLAQQRQFDPARKMLAHLKPHNADLQAKVTILNTLLAN